MYVPVFDNYAHIAYITYWQKQKAYSRKQKSRAFDIKKTIGIVRISLRRILPRKSRTGINCPLETGAFPKESDCFRYVGARRM